MTKEDYEMDADMLVRITTRMKDWHPDALAYVAQERETAMKYLTEMEETVSKQRVA